MPTGAGMKQRALLVGLGAIGWRGSQPDAPRSNCAANETHYHTMKHHPQIEFAGGVDVDDAARREFQQATAALVYPDLATALSEAKPAIVIIATPPETHRALVLEAASCPSVKGILCEKPLAPTIVECQSMVGACNAVSIPLVVGHQRRYEQRHRLLRAFLKSEALGKPVAGACYFSGTYLNNGTHAADVMRFLLGDGPWSIYQKAGEVFNAWVSTEHGAITLSSRGNLEPGYMKAMYDNLLECMDTGHTPECSGEDGLEAVRLALAAEEAHEAAA